MTLNRDAVSETLHKIVEETGPDYVYQIPEGTYGDCVYADPVTGAPSCIVGHVVAALDPEAFERMAKFEDEAGPFTIMSAIDPNDWARVDVGLEVDSADLRSALAMAQEAQDRGMTWGEAQEYFDRVLDGEDREELIKEMLSRKPVSFK
jgi:hypothetical protein